MIPGRGVNMPELSDEDRQKCWDDMMDNAERKPFITLFDVLIPSLIACIALAVGIAFGG